ncbi:hypothetical protein [Brucella lupini]
MELPVNGARGEVGVTIGGVEIVLAATMKGLAAVSQELGCKSMNDLFARLSDAEINAAMVGLRHLTVQGDAAAAIERLNLSHFASLSTAFQAALAHHFKGEPAGNGEAGGK